MLTTVKCLLDVHLSLDTEEWFLHLTFNSVSKGHGESMES